MIAQPRPIGVVMLEALGLPSKRCTSLTLEFKPNSVVVARAEYHAEDIDAAAVEVLRQWREGAAEG